MVRAGAPKRIWGDALEFEAYVRSNIALYIYMLQGEVPETIMFGGNSDVSQFCEHGFYDWVMFRDEPIQYPDENPVLGRYLGPEIDVGLAMRDKIMKANDEAVHCFKYRGLKEDEKSNQAHILLRKEFYNSIRDRLGTDISTDDFPDVSLEDTPLYEMYEYKTTNAEGGLAGKNEDYEDPVMSTVLYREFPTPEVNENYVNNLFIFPRGNSYARGKVIGRKRNSEGNAV